MDYNPQLIGVHANLIQDISTILPPQSCKVTVSATDYFIFYPVDEDSWFDTGTNAPKDDASGYILGVKQYGGASLVTRNSKGAIKWSDRNSIFF